MPFTNLSLLNLSLFNIQTGNYTVLASDDVVDFSISVATTATLPSAILVPTGKRITLKNVATLTTGILQVLTTGGQTIDGRASGSIFLSPNDLAQVVSDGTNWRTIVLQETIAALYNNTAGTTINNVLTTVPFANKIFDTHSAFSAGVFTAPVAGRYAYTSSGWSVSTLNTSSSIYWQGYKNLTTLYGQDNKAGTGAVNSGNAVRITGIVDLAVGETFQVRASIDTVTSVNLDTYPSTQVFSIHKIGS